MARIRMWARGMWSLWGAIGGGRSKSLGTPRKRAALLRRTKFGVSPMQAATADRIKPPSMLLALTELQRAMFELSTLPAAAPILGMAPKGDGHPVLVLPGFTASDKSTAILRRYLN